METKLDIGTYIGKAHVFAFSGKAGEREAARYLNLHQEPDGSLVLLSRTNPNPGDGSGEDPKQVSAVIIPLAVAPAVIEALGFPV